MSSGVFSGLLKKLCGAGSVMGEYGWLSRKLSKESCWHHVCLMPWDFVIWVHYVGVLENVKSFILPENSLIPLQ